MTMPSRCDLSVPMDFRSSCGSNDLMCGDATEDCSGFLMTWLICCLRRWLEAYEFMEKIRLSKKIKNGVN